MHSSRERIHCKTSDLAKFVVKHAALGEPLRTWLETSISLRKVVGRKGNTEIQTKLCQL